MTTKFNPRARAEEIAAQLKAAEEAQREYDASIDEALKHAGRTRAEFVEVLYHHFGIEPEVTERKVKSGELVRNKDGQAVLVKTDRDEAVRIGKLAGKFEELVAKADRAVSGESSPKQQSDDGGTEMKSSGSASVSQQDKAA